MRFHIVLFACLVATPFASPVLADPATSAQPAASTSSPPAATSTPVSAPPASSATAASPTEPASSPAPAASAAAALDAVEKQVISMGYKPQMHHGEKVFCKREPVMGSRVETTENCKTLAELKAQTQISRQFTENSQRMSSPAGH